MTRWIIVNPRAGSGRAEAVGRRLQAILDDTVIMPTQSPGDATRIARRARSLGIETIVAVGGDGTIHECATGLVLNDEGMPKSGETNLAICPAGTGGDYRKTFDFSDSIEQAVARIRDPNLAHVDVGRLTYMNRGSPFSVAFANVASFGLGGLTDRLVSSGPKWLGGKVAFFLGAVKANLAYRPVPIELTLDGRKLQTAPYSNVAVCCGRFFGGGMKIAPSASPSDGLFDVVTMELSKFETLTLAADIYRGRHLDRERVNHYQCQRLEARLTRQGECLIDVDGEQLGELPLSVEILPGALRLLI